MATTDVKAGDRVIYAIGDVEYNGVALGTGFIGMHPGHKRASKHLNLIYLNEQGTPVKIYGAPLLSRAESAEDSAHFAEMNARVAPKGSDLTTPTAMLKYMTDTPRTIGWRPYVDGEEVAGLKAMLAQVTAENAKLQAELLAAQTAVVVPAAVASTGMVITCAEATDATGNPSSADLDSAAADEAAAQATTAS